ncbi:probable dolichyl pyrophosphate Man9GlcNAc2 alpha-1,3-glucosyltransferase isoform X3 [Drosophila virilis]|uniref:probable dolichyl pyrophosphate Man9GlcNAc2 alpha-1,3-glucosyltransferase isoform X3 n=1 Tax=Drosophila virilis TaxID=7244 RepID=UPI0038B24B3B
MYSEMIAAIFGGLALRSIISMNSYSGFNQAPMFGDYEAQRHWQEVTTNLDVKNWYTNGTHNDLQYWGLDYPPLTAYHSYLTGRVAKLLNYSYVELHTSRGIETKEHKSFMRLTVLAADILIYMPAIIAISVCMDLTFEKNLKHHLLVLLAIYPGQILIDNGHFQYNNISLGFLALAVAALLCNRNNIAALTFTLALNYKQMELYHALPFFAYLLSVCFSQNSSLILRLRGVLFLAKRVFNLPSTTTTNSSTKTFDRRCCHVVRAWSPRTHSFEHHQNYCSSDEKVRHRFKKDPASPGRLCRQIP